MKYVRVVRRFKFDAAHFLPNYPGKCARLHGHTWSLHVAVEGSVDPHTGFVIDFSKLKDIVGEHVLSKLDHTCLNEAGLPFSDNPTCERIVQWICNTLSTRVPCRRLYVRLWESPDSFAETFARGCR